jgi:hypothetical protein
MFGTPQSGDISELEGRISDSVESVTRNTRILTKVWREIKYLIDFCHVIYEAHIDGLQATHPTSKDSLPVNVSFINNKYQCFFNCTLYLT